MQGSDVSAHKSSRQPPAGRTIDVPRALGNLGILKQEVDLGVQALNRENADMAVTLFQSALQKLTADQPLYHHLVHNLLLSYKLVIEHLLRRGESALARDFLRAALRLEIRGCMAENRAFVRKFAGAFQSLGTVFNQHQMSQEGVWCCEKANSIDRSSEDGGG
jgi:hypothetical protein